MEEIPSTPQTSPPDKDYFAPNDTPPNREIYKSPSRILLKFIGMALVFVIIIGAAGSWLFKDVIFKKPTLQPTPTPDMTKVVPPTDPTADWKTYRNDEYGFEFKYPSNAILDDSKNGDFLVHLEIPKMNPESSQGPQFLIHTTHNTSKLSAKEALDNHIAEIRSNSPSFADEIIPSIENSVKEYENGQVIGVTYKSDWEIQSNEVMFTNENFTYRFILYSDTTELLDQLLSTFKIIEPLNLPAISTWEKYETQDFTIMYPPGWHMEEFAEGGESGSAGYVTFTSLPQNQCNTDHCNEFTVELYNPINGVSDQYDFVQKLNINENGELGNSEFRRKSDMDIDSINGLHYIQKSWVNQKDNLTTREKVTVRQDNRYYTLSVNEGMLDLFINAIRFN